MNTQNTPLQGIKVKCPHCGYEWIYKGKLLSPTCPSCQRKFRIGRWCR